MADWRQIQARIRKARASSNPAEQLAELHQRTRDAMVAFELARLHEKNGDNAEAARWYTTAAQQFRRAQWRVKAEEALSRLGAELPPRAVAADRAEAIEESSGTGDASRDIEAESEQPEIAWPKAGKQLDEEHAAEEKEETVEFGQEQATESAAAGGSAQPEAPEASAGRKRRRRGRRGGRKHKRGGVAGQESGGMQEAGGREHEPLRPNPLPHPNSSPARYSGGYRQTARPEPPRDAAETESAFDRAAESGHPQRLEPAASAVPGRARGAEPALSSRMAQLESRLRRLLACPLASLADAEDAPAGPGVLLLSDSDQVTHYYIEACQTLRIGIANLWRGGRGSKEAGRLKPVMAEHLGIGESAVSKYMKEHCVVRWLQLDEEAPELAHFAIAVLRPVVNE